MSNKPLEIYIYGTTSTGKTLLVHLIEICLSRVGISSTHSDHYLFKNYADYDFDKDFISEKALLESRNKSVHIYSINDRKNSLRVEIKNLPLFLIVGAGKNFWSKVE